MTGERPSDVMRAYTRTFARAGVDAAARLWDPEIEWRPLEADEAHSIRGLDAMRSYYAEWVDTMDDLQGDITEVVFEDDERAALQVRASGRGRASGAPVTATYYVACLICDGRIVVAHEYGTRDEAVLAARSL